MSKHIIGVSAALTPLGGTFDFDDTGRTIYRERFHLADPAQLASVLPTRGVTPHPLDPAALCSSCKGERNEETGDYTIEVEYSTLDGGGVISFGAANDGGHVEVIGSLMTEPIETHPSFATMAGTGESPLNGAKFEEILDADGNPKSPREFTFEGWAANSQYAGLESYLEPTVRCRISETSAFKLSSSDMAKLGTIQTPSSSDVSTPPGRNWLLTDLSQVKNGSDWVVTKEYTLSGRNGWNTTIYT